MLPFRSICEESNTHIEHIEDLIFLYGKKGIDYALSIFESITQNSLDISEKWDGAPAIIFGRNSKGFFVSTKSYFNKTPLLNYTTEDIEINHKNSSLELRNKLKQCLKYLSEIKTNSILYGDFLFDSSSLKIKEINNNKYITFAPNTITYAVPIPSQKSKEIISKKLGIVIHSQVVNGKVVPFTKQIKSTHNVFITISKKPENIISNNIMNNIEQEIESITLPNNFDDIVQDKNLLMMYYNYTLKNELPINEKTLIDFVALKNKKINTNLGTIFIAFEIHSLLQELKMNILNNLQTNIQSFVSINGKYEKINGEGFVINSTPIRTKLIDRNMFSKINMQEPKKWN